MAPAGRSRRRTLRTRSGNSSNGGVGGRANRRSRSRRGGRRRLRGQEGSDAALVGRSASVQHGAREERGPQVVLRGAQHVAERVRLPLGRSGCSSCCGCVPTRIQQSSFGGRRRMIVCVALLLRGMLIRCLLALTLAPSGARVRDCEAMLRRRTCCSCACRGGRCCPHRGREIVSHFAHLNAQHKVAQRGGGGEGRGRTSSRGRTRTGGRESLAVSAASTGARRSRSALQLQQLRGACAGQRRRVAAVEPIEAGAREHVFRAPARSHALPECAAIQQSAGQTLAHACNSDPAAHRRRVRCRCHCHCMCCSGLISRH
jgi:hypothetical protein